MQRHHLLPRQLLLAGWFGRMFEAIGPSALGFDDFRRNGLLLPASDEAAARIGLPLHRGPHRRYSEMVADRVGQIERDWACRRGGTPEAAREMALARLALLQRALRRRLLATDRPPVKLNARVRLADGPGYAELDAMAERLWAATAMGQTVS